MRILFLLYSLGGGGTERVTATLSNYWTQHGKEVAIATLSDGVPDFYDLHPQVHRVSLNLQQVSKNVLAATHYNIRRIAAVRKLIRQNSPDVVIAMGTTANVLLSLASIGMQRRVFVGSERAYPPMPPLPKFWQVLRQYSYRYLTALVAQTAKMREWIQQNTNARRVVVIPNPVEFPIPSGVPHLEPQKVVSSRGKWVIAVGRLEHEKGFDLLVQAFGRITANHPDWNLAILGEGRKRPELERQRTLLGLSSRVIFPGRVGNLGDWYQASHLFVLSSRYEGFPNVLLEAMAYGLPAVCFDCDTGPSDIVQTGVNGILVPVGDVDALSQAIDMVMRDDALRRSLAERAVEVRERFRLEKVASQWEGLFGK